jgi:hypothetical protein
MRTCLRPGSEERSQKSFCFSTYIVFCDHSGHRALGRPERCAPDGWPPEMVTLEIADTFGAQQRRVLGVLDAFGHRAQTEAVEETDQMAEKNPGLWPARQIANQRAIDLDDVDRQDLKMPQRGMPGAKIVERNAAPGMAQSVDKARRFRDVAQCRGFRDFDDEAAGDVAAVAQ